MNDHIHLGINRTGLMMHPLRSREMLEAVVDDEEPTPEQQALLEARSIFVHHAAELGSIPAPLSVKGLLKTGAELLAGKRPQVLIDKMTERLAFERASVRLYDALIVKCMAHTPAPRGLSADGVIQIRQTEIAHFELLMEYLNLLGADATAQTPSADVAGIACMGLLQVVTDPRSSLAHAMQAALTAELADHAAWTFLTALAAQADQEEMAKKFLLAKDEEETHLSLVRSWYEGLVLDEARLSK